MSEDLVLILLLVFAFVLAILVAAAETALLRMPMVRAQTLASEYPGRGARVRSLLQRLPTVLNAILLTALLTQIGAATIVGVLAERWFGGLGVTIASILLTVVLFVYAEAIPKTFAVQHVDTVALRLAGFIAVIELLLRPLVSLLVWFADLQMPGEGITTSPTVTEDELRLLAGHAVAEGTIADHDRELIERAFRFGDRQCDDVMVPRAEIVAVQGDATLEEARDVALAHGHRRLPVYGDSLDQIVGMVRLRELVAAADDQPSLAVKRVSEAPLHVPESKRIVDLLAEMQETGVHLAVVVDEYGGTAGLVTVEDIAEELLGSISEDDTADLVQGVADGRWSVDGLTPVEDLVEILGVDIPEGEWNTVGGLFIGLSGKLARVGDEVQLPAATMRVRAIRGRRITRLEVIAR
jgi:CBS domain containing-hemolysin-like protein